MKLIKAIWEKKNLGIDCVEINCDRDDSVELLIKTIEEEKTQYQVLRIPSGCTELLLSAQSKEFKYIETNISLSKKISDSTKDKLLPKIYIRYKPNISIKEANEKEVEHVLQKIRNERIFDTDKIARDTYFSKSKDLTAIRYSNWSKNVIDKGAKMFLDYYKDEMIGFSINYNKGKFIYDAFLGGVFEEYTNKGLGFLPLYGNLVSSKMQNAKELITGVSSNNLPMLRLHMLFGFEIKKMTYILVKHRD